MKTQKTFTPSVKEAVRIARKYKYCIEVIRVYPKKAFLSIYSPAFKTPYPKHFLSTTTTIKYIEKVIEIPY